MKRSANLPSPPLDAACVPWLLAAALATAGPHAPHQPLGWSCWRAPRWLWRALLWWRRGALPARWLLLAVMLAGVIGIALHYRTLFGRDAGVALLVLLMAGNRSRRAAGAMRWLSSCSATSFCSPITFIPRASPPASGCLLR